MANSAAPSAGRVFISYRREETAYAAGWLFNNLADRFGRGQIFKDIDSVEPGDNFVEVITTAVASCDVLLVLIGDRWLTITDEHGRARLDHPDDFVRLEIEAALTRDVRVIPILLAGARMPDEDQLPPSLAGLARRQALELSPSHFEFDTSRLHKVLDRTLADVHTQRVGRGGERLYRDSSGKPNLLSAGVVDPVSLIVAALVAGAAAAGKDVGSGVVKDAYDGLNALLVNRFRRKAADQRTTPSSSAVDPVAVLDAHESKPDAWNTPLEDALRHAGADRDQKVLAAAKALLQQADPEGAAAGKYQVDLRGAQGVQVGDHGQMTVNFGVRAPRPAGPTPGS